MCANNDTFNIVSWNAQSISNESKLTELRLLLNDYDVHVACIQETFLTSNMKIHIQNYTIYRNDRSTHGGGVAIIVRNNISHRLLKLHNTSSIENISIEVTNYSKKFIITSAYNPHFSPTNFVGDIELLTNQPTDTLILGDFNAKHTAWNCTNCDRAGNALHSFINSSLYALMATATPTHIPHSGACPSTLDLLITNTSIPIVNLCTLDRLISDHYPILCQIGTRHEETTNISYKYKLANWDAYRQFIENNIGELAGHLNSSTEIDEAITKTTELITAARDFAVPRAIHREALFKIAPDTLSAIRYRNKLRRNWQRCPVGPTRNQLKTAVNIIDKLIRDLVGRDRNRRWHEFMGRVDDDTRKLWRLSRSLRGKRKSAPNVLRHEGARLISDTEKANAFAEVFKKAHTTTLNCSHPHDVKIDNFTRKFARRNHFTDRVNVTSAELSGCLHALRPFKAPGNDGMQNVLLKNLPESGTKLLCKIFNSAIRLNFWPSSFKNAKVIPIPKPGKDDTLVASYRPISLLNTLAKLFEKIIHSRLMDFATENEILNEEQFGFRPQHSTAHQILRVTRHIRLNWSQRKSTGMVLFDIEKAFDSVWHDGLIYKLKRFGFPDYLCGMIREFTKHRTFTVHVGGAMSSPTEIPAGLPQGSILSPSLYSLYVSDLKFHSHTDSACYADDTAVYASANRTSTIVRRLQTSLNTVQEFFDKWRIKANPAKTQAIIFPFDGKRKRLPTIQLVLNGTQIEYSNSVTYLGVCLDRKLNFKEHIATLRNKANRSIAALYPIIGRRSILDQRNKLLVYKSVIRPILTYASIIWKAAAQSNRKQIQILQNKCLKIIMRLPRRYPTNELHSLTNVPTIADFTNKINEKFNDKCALSAYRLIRELSNEVI